MSLLSDMFPDKVIAGSTAQKNAIAPKLNQKFFDTSIGKEQQWDGTVWKDVVPAATYTPPPAAGPIGGTVSATHWRVVVTSAISSSVGVRTDFLWTTPFSVKAVAASNVPSIVAKAPSSLGRALTVNSSGTAYNLTVVSGAVPLIVNFTYTTPVTPNAIGMINPQENWIGIAAPMGTYTVESSIDNGLSWVVQHRGSPSSNAPTVLSAHNYPSNPADGQSFLNTTTGLNMHWSATDSKWLPDPKFNKWITLSVAAIADMTTPNMLVDTTAAALTITLPPLPKYGSSVMLADAKGTWVTNACIVVPSPGNTLMGGTVGIVLTTTSTIVWNGTDWRIV